MTARGHILWNKQRFIVALSGLCATISKLIISGELVLTINGITLRVNSLF